MHNGISTAPIRAAAPAPASMPIPGLVWAFRIDPDGSAAVLPIDKPLDLARDGLLWLHFNLADGRALQWLAAAELDAPPPARALLLSKDTYQQLHATDDAVYGVICDLMRSIDETTEDTGYLRFVMTERLLVSGRHQPLSAVDTVRRALEDGHRIDNAAALLEAIVENVAATMERMADRVAQSLDMVEEQVLSGETADLHQKLGPLRRTCVRLHRQLSGLRVIFHRLDHRNAKPLNPALQLRAGMLAQRLDSLDHNVVEMRERSRLLQEELQLQIEEQGNDSLRVLSVLTALLLPPTLITGVFGMNTRSLPFSDSDSSFLWAVGLMVLSSLIAYLIMRRIGIIR
ncbi:MULTISPECIES: transporter [Rhodopseudomonas]|uniref:Cobalt transporter n=1 Tax=Rhodopseudomonas palustris TaxID=1076 RepID=A0A0D7E140_RHOPL|nr:MULTISPECIES: transporter [Rhodopseudomonas]KIZ34206.1 cobalt transporter [Rhodopseudomonas palustris]MDF3812519.1 transporter [Rhodopseudomonas sp. BAL398]WOK17349.1 transporter [Rhodopseudomonas sp. BAL398]